MIRKNIVFVIIGMILVGLITPFALEQLVFKNMIPSTLTNGEWGSFLGSFIGGIIGGIGTLFAVFFSISETRDIQNESRDIIFYDREVQKNKEKRIHTDEIANLISAFISDYTENIIRKSDYLKLCKKEEEIKKEIDILIDRIENEMRYVFDESNTKKYELKRGMVESKRLVLETELKHINSEKLMKIPDFTTARNNSLLIQMKIRKELLQI